MSFIDVFAFALRIARRIKYRLGALEQAAICKPATGVQSRGGRRWRGFRCARMSGLIKHRVSRAIEGMEHSSSGILSGLWAGTRYSVTMCRWTAHCRPIGVGRDSRFLDRGGLPLWVLAWLFVLGGCFSVKGGGAALSAPTLRFLETHCFECHGSVHPKAGLSIDALPAPSASASGLKRWIHVFDRLDRGEMPPASEPRPSAAATQQVLTELRAELTHLSREAQAREGRALVRRLNRVELEFTLSDLLGMPVAVQHLLPEDSLTSGFDTVSVGLGMSSAHWLRYQEVADRVIDAALAWAPLAPERRRVTGRQWFQGQMRSARSDSEWKVKGSARVEGDRALVFARSTEHSYLDFTLGKPVVPGRYRVRASVSAVNTGEQPLPALFFLQGPGELIDGSQHHVLDVLDAEPGPQRVLELQVQVPYKSPRFQGRSIALSGWTLPLQHPVGVFEAMELIGEKPHLEGPALALDWMELEGPLDPWPTAAYRRLFGDLPAKRPDPLQPVEPQSLRPREDADRLIRDFLPRAFRRPAPPALAQEYVDIAHRALDEGRPFVAAMRQAYRAVLSSPYFVLRLESPGALDGYAIASRLSYFLWSSCPDETLLKLAREEGRLKEPAVLDAQVERLLTDPRSSRFVRQFTQQWLELHRLYETKPDLMYGEFDDLLLWSMPLETQGMFQEILAGDRSVAEFIQSDWSFLNRRLAEHYSIPGVSSWIPRRASLPGSAHRGGVITHASILKLTSNGTATSPVRRGAWILDKILGKPPSPPPPGVGAIEPDIRGAVTVREQLAKHQADPSCARCHREIDPPGFAMENFDVIGGWREWYRSNDIQDRRARLPNYPRMIVSRGVKVESFSVTSEGRAFVGVDEYKQILLQDLSPVVRSLASKLLTYSTGAEPQFADREIVDQLTRESVEGGAKFRSLVRAVVRSRPFLEK